MKLLTQHRIVWGAVIALLSLPLSGCGRSLDKNEAAGAPTAKQALTDLADLLKHFQDEKKRTPARVADIEPIEPIFPAAYLGLVRDEIVYVWGAPLDSSGGDKVLAYEKTSDEEPRWVLMQDGAVKQMQASEFQAATKAKK